MRQKRAAVKKPGSCQAFYSGPFLYKPGPDCGKQNNSQIPNWAIRTSALHNFSFSLGDKQQLPALHVLLKYFLSLDLIQNFPHITVFHFPSFPLTGPALCNLVFQILYRLFPAISTVPLYTFFQIPSQSFQKMDTVWSQVNGIL